MKVSDLLEHGFKEVVLADGAREIEGAYTGDLLSWVMGRCKEGQAWLTIMSNRNVIAVATLSDPSCVILTEGVALDEETTELAKAKGINILSTELPSYEACVLLSECLK